MKLCCMYSIQQLEQQHTHPSPNLQIVNGRRASMWDPNIQPDADEDAWEENFGNKARANAELHNVNSWYKVGKPSFGIVSLVYRSFL